MDRQVLPVEPCLSFIVTDPVRGDSPRVGTPLSEGRENMEKVAARSEIGLSQRDTSVQVSRVRTQLAACRRIRHERRDHMKQKAREMRASRPQATLRELLESAEHDYWVSVYSPRVRRGA
jgi:hypothetical protein